MGLIKKPATTTTKTAAAAIVTGSPETWSAQILDAFFRNNDFAGKYNTSLVLERQDITSGSAYGGIIVSELRAPAPSPTAGARSAPWQSANPDTGVADPAQQSQQPAQGGAQPQQATESAGAAPPPQGYAPAPPSSVGTSVRVPVIMFGGTLEPMDVFIDSADNFQPFTPQRVRVALAASPDMVPGAPQAGASQEASLTEGDPPYRGKIASLDIRTSKEALSTLIKEAGLSDVDRARALDNDLLKNSLTKMASAAPKRMTSKPEVAALVKVGGGFDLVTYTQDDGFSSSFVPNNGVGGDVAKRAIESGYAILGNGPRRETVKEASPATSSGVYLVPAGGSMIRAALFTDVISLEGNKVDGSLLVYPGGYCSTENPIGVKTASLRSVGAAEPVLGTGVFLLRSGEVTSPITISRMYKEASGDGYTTTVVFSGDTFSPGGTAILSPRVDRPVKVNTETYLIPENSTFLPVGRYGQLDTSVESVKVAQRLGSGHINIGLSSEAGDLFVSGAGIDGEPLTAPKAILVLADAGVPIADAAQALTKVARGGPGCNLRGRRKAPKLVKAASAQVNVSGIKANLVKLAAQLSDQASVDAALSLGLITPENAEEFIQALPQFESVLLTACRLLVASRIGMPDTDKGALAIAVKTIDKSISGLKDLEARLRTSAV